MIHLAAYFSLLLFAILQLVYAVLENSALNPPYNLLLQFSLVTLKTYDFNPQVAEKIEKFKQNWDNSIKEQEFEAIKKYISVFETYIDSIIESATKINSVYTNEWIKLKDEFKSPSILLPIIKNNQNELDNIYKSALSFLEYKNFKKV